jgi:phosphoglycolate phosphatase
MKAFIFDLDGTLLNSLEDIAQSCNVVLRRHNWPEHPLPAYRQMVGRGFDYLVRSALPADVLAELAPEGLRPLVEEARAWYGGHMCEHTRPYDGLDGALQALCAGGRVLAVLSNKPDELTTDLVRRYFPGIPFALVRGARPGVPLKPDPAAPREMLAALGLAAKDACYVGDSDVDVYTARNAGMTAVGAGWGFRGAAELEAAGAACVLDAPGRLAELL